MLINNLKRITFLLVTIVFMCGSFTTAFAATDDDTKSNGSDVQTFRSPEYEYKVEVASTEVQYSPWIAAGGQPSGGTNFGSGGGSFSWINGGSTVAVSFSLAVGKNVSVGVSIGNISGGVGAYNINVPNNLINQKVLLYVKKEITFTVRALYKRPMSRIDVPWIFDSYYTSWEETSRSFEVRKAN